MAELGEDNDFDKDMATAAKSSQVSQFSETLDDIDDLSEDDEVISEFLHGLNEDEVDVKKSPVDEPNDAMQDVEETEVSDTSNDLFDGLFDEEDTYESSQQEDTKNSILKTIRENPITDDKVDIFEDLEGSSEDLPLKNTSKSAKQDAAVMTHSIYPSPKNYVGMVLGGVSLCLFLALAGYSYLLQRNIETLQASIQAVTEAAGGKGPSEQLDAISGRISRMERQLQDTTTAMDARLTESAQAQSDALKKLSRSAMSNTQDIVKLEDAVETLKKTPPVVVKKIVRSAPRTEQVTTPATTQKRTPSIKNWVVNIASFASSAAADKTLLDLRSRGIDVQKTKVTVNGRPWYRLRVFGFANKKAAQRYSDKLKKLPDISNPWITRNN